MTPLGPNAARALALPTPPQAYSEADQRAVRSAIEAAYAQVAAAAANRVLLPWFDPVDYGADLTGTIGSSAAINKAATLAEAAGGGIVYSRRGVYLLDATVDIPNTVTWLGQGKTLSIIRKGFDGDMVNLGEGSVMDMLYLDGNAPLYTGRGILVNTSDGRQSVHRCKITNTLGYAVEFTDPNAGSQSCWVDCEIMRYHADAISYPGVYSIKIPDAQQLAATPRKFIGCESSGSQFIDFGGCNNTFVSGGFAGGFKYSAESRGVWIANTRIGNQATMDMYGYNHTIAGCDINPQIVLHSLSEGVAIAGNSYNQDPPIIDNSGKRKNFLETWATDYTPTMSSGGVAPSLGDGTLTAEWSRNGTVIECTINFIMGATTNLGTGDLRFSLPQTPNSAFVQVGSAYAFQAATGNAAIAAAVIGPATSYVFVQLGAALGPVAFNQPWVWVAGDLLRISIRYQV